MKDSLQIIDKKLIPFLAFLPGLILVLYYVLGPAAGHMTSDSTDSLRWAQASYLSGRLVSGNFGYAALLPFGGNQIFLPFIAIFGYSLTAQIAGLVVFVLLFAIALYYFARGLDLSPALSGGLVSVSMLLLSLSGKLREIMWEHIFYYNLGILFFCIGFGLVLRILKNSGLQEPKARRRNRIRLVVLGIFSLLAAMDGLQTLVMYTLPLVAALAVDRLADTGTPLLGKSNLRIYGIIGLILGASALGFVMIPLISHGVKAGYADAYSSFSAMSKWVDNFRNILPNWLSLCGVSVKDGQHFIGLKSIEQAIKIMGSLFLFIFPLIQLFRLPRLKNRGVRMLAVGHGAVTAFILFAVVFGRLGAANWRLTPILGTAVLLSYSVIVQWIKNKQASLRGAAVALALLLILALLPALEIAAMPSNQGRDNAWFTAAAFLKEKELRYGYATFWWGELITMLSGNQAVVSNMEIKDGAPARRTYQDFLDCYKDRNTDRYFLLIDEREKKNLADWLKEAEEQGRILEDFTIDTEAYAAGGSSGTQLYVYVFSDNFLGD